MNSHKDGEVIRTKSKRETRQTRERTKLLAEESKVIRGAVGSASTSAENDERVSKIKLHKTEDRKVQEEANGG